MWSLLLCAATRVVISSCCPKSGVCLNVHVIISTWDFVLIFATLGILIPWRGAARVRSLLARPQVSPADRLSIYASTIAFQWFLVGFVVWRCFVHRFNAEELALNLHWPLLTALVAAGLVIGLGVLQYIGIRRTAMLPVNSDSRLRQISVMLMPRSLIEALVFFALAITASLCEEFLFRGFVYAVVGRVTQSAVLAIVGSSLLFSLAHLYQGRRGLISTFVLGLLFAGSRLWVGSMVPAVAGHLTVDLLAGYLGPRYLHKAVNQVREEQTLAVGVSESGELKR